MAVNFKKGDLVRSINHDDFKKMGPGVVLGLSESLSNVLGDEYAVYYGKIKKRLRCPAVLIRILDVG